MIEIYFWNWGQDVHHILNQNNIYQDSDCTLEIGGHLNNYTKRSVNYDVEPQEYQRFSTQYQITSIIT